MAVLDWIKSLAGSPAVPSARVIVAPPDVEGAGTGGGGRSTKSESAAASPEEEPDKEGAAEPSEPKKDEPQSQEEEEKTDTDEAGGSASSESDDDNEDDESTKEPSMSTVATPPKNDTGAPAAEKAASVSELKAQFPSETDFVLSCAEKGLSLRDAKAAFADELQSRLADANKKIEAKDRAIKGLGDEGKSGEAAPLAPAGARQTKVIRPSADGAKVNPDRLKRAGDAFASYDEAVQEYEDRGAPRAMAFRQAAIDHPELHASWRQTNGKAYTEQRAGRKR